MIASVFTAAKAYLQEYNYGSKSMTDSITLGHGESRLAFDSTCIPGVTSMTMKFSGFGLFVK
jgi:hypothetical protein